MFCLIMFFKILNVGMLLCLLFAAFLMSEAHKYILGLIFEGVCYIITCGGAHWQWEVYMFCTAPEIRKPRTKPQGTQLGTEMDM